MSDQPKPSDDTRADDAAEQNIFHAEDAEDAADSEAAVREELDQMRDKWLRTQAELDNYRKRARKELEDERRYADMGLLRDLLPIVDNLDRAIAAAEQSPQAESLLQGVQIVADQLQAVFKQHDCLPINPLGEAFDPHLHEAISQQPSEEHEPGVVTHVTQVGYILHDRVVRPAQVIVAALPE